MIEKDEPFHLQYEAEEFRRMLINKFSVDKNISNIPQLPQKNPSCDMGEMWRDLHKRIKSQKKSSRISYG